MKNVIFKLIVPLLGIIAMLGFITLYNPIQQQDAKWLEGAQQYSCDGGKVVVHIDPASENPSCSTGTNSTATHYQTGMNVSATGATSDYTIHWGWASYWCQNSSTSPCLDHSVVNASSHALSSSFIAYSQDRGATGSFAGQACGVYQNDFGFYVTKNSTNATVCGISLNNLGNTNNNAAWCNTRGTCQAPTNTPMPPTATPTQPEQPTATPTLPEQPTATPTQPEQQPTATPTPTGVVATATPTGTNTNNCDNTNQSGNNDNNNCNQNNNNNNNENNNNNQQQQQQTQNNNQTVNISLGSGQQQQQQVLAAATAPTTLPKTGAETPIILGLLSLIPVGWKLRKLV
jgi:hypothetical protein